jgi:hypothetical protein
MIARFFCGAFIATLLLSTSSVVGQDRRASEDLVAAAQGMNAYLASLPEPNQTGWKQYFAWEKWGPALSGNGAPDKQVLEDVTSRFYGVHEGLEAPALMRMRGAIQRYLGEDRPASSDAAHPVLLVRVRKSLLEAELGKLATTRVDLRDTGNWIAGAWVTGKAHSQLNVMAKLASYRDQAAIEVQMWGTIDTPQTVATKGAFQVYGSAASQLNGFAYLYLENDAIRVSEPQFQSQTQSQISWVDGPRPLRGIAERQAGKKLGQGEAESSDIIASQAAREFKQELEAEIAKSTNSFSSYDFYQLLLKRADLAPSQIATNLFDDSVSVGIRFPGSGAKSLPASKTLPDDTAAEISMHESLLSSVSANFVRGTWWSDEDFSRLQKELTGSNANELLIGTAPERWAVRWDWAAPVGERITSEHLEYRLRFSSAKIDGREIASPFLIVARFRPVATRWGLEFRRVGDVELTADGEIAAKDANLLRRKFGGLFGEAVYLDGISPPAGGGWDEVTRYVTSGVRLEDGWLHMDFRQQEKRTKVVAK